MKKAIFIYDYTGIMAKPWADAGYECWLFDGQHEPGIHRGEDGIVRVGMWFYQEKIVDHAAEIAEMVGDGVEFLFGFPECTHLAVSGSRHFSSKLAADKNIQFHAVTLARMVEVAGALIGCPWGLENPVSVMSSIWRKPDYLFDPHEYGGYLPDDDVHPLYPEYIAPRGAYPKKTCIWSGRGFVMPDKRPVYCPSGWSTQHNKLGGKSLKTKNIRSATPRGFAKAVFEANKK